MNAQYKANLILDVFESLADKHAETPRRAKTEARKIRARYSELKRTVDFSTAARQAKFEWMNEYLAC